MEDIKLSISCITYNHENYIRDTIDSFLMQKVDFPMEILIHDDASTDNTTKVIEKYEQEYSDIIKPIYQLENQYSKGVDVSKLNSERSRGKYIAICEGDDYWTDPFKLQKQIDYLETHPECSLVVHDARIMDTKTGKLMDSFRPSIRSKSFSVEEIILGGGGLFPTNSMVFRSKYYKKLPNFYKDALIKDYPLTIYLALLGDVYYIDEPMSAYRYLVPGSWTARMSNNIENIIEHFDEISNMLNEIDIYSEYKYSDTIKKTKAINEFNLLVAQGKIAEAKRRDIFAYYSSLDIKKKMVINIKQYFPSLARCLQNIRRKTIDAKSKY